MIATAPILPVKFDHADHGSVNCLECHHNYVDDSGEGYCYLCHKTDITIAADIEEMFHDLCRDCHVTKSSEGEKSGPVRRCVDCHPPAS